MGVFLKIFALYSGWSWPNYTYIHSIWEFFGISFLGGGRVLFGIDWKYIEAYLFCKVKLKGKEIVATN